MKAILKRSLTAIALLCLLGLSIYLSESAFKQVLDFRALERIPASVIVESVGGESQLVGQAVQHERLLTAPKSVAGSLYFRYLLEKMPETQDSRHRFGLSDPGVSLQLLKGLLLDARSPLPSPGA